MTPHNEIAAIFARACAREAAPHNPLAASEWLRVAENYEDQKTEEDRES